MLTSTVIRTVSSNYIMEMLYFYTLHVHLVYDNAIRYVLYCWEYMLTPSGSLTASGTSTPWMPHVAMANRNTWENIFLISILRKCFKQVPVTPLFYVKGDIFSVIIIKWTTSWTYAIVSSLTDKGLSVVWKKLFATLWTTKYRYKMYFTKCWLTPAVIFWDKKIN